MIIVAGSSGLVGSAIMRNLANSGLEATGISRKTLDLTNRTAVFDFIKKISPVAVIDAAAIVGGIGANAARPVDFLSENLQIQTNLMDAAHAAQVERFVFLGSSCIYPRLAEQPISESSLLTGPLEPTNRAYAIAKIAGVELINSYRAQHGARWISLMPTNLYGPFDNFSPNSGHVLPSLVTKFYTAKSQNQTSVELWGTGTPLRDFLHVDDLAEAVKFALENYDSSNPLNVGSSSEITIKELAGMVASAVGFTGTIIWDQTKPNGTPRKLLDSSTITNLGWRPKIELSEGIKEVVDWFLNEENAGILRI
jgi:GDP-L-fucose synthase